MDINAKSLLGEKADEAEIRSLHSRHEHCFLHLRYGREVYSCTEYQKFIDYMEADESEDGST